MRRICCFTAVALIVAASPIGAAGSASAAPKHYPRVMAAAGDSITRAFDVGWCCILRDDPSRSWSTGSDPAVDSHYLRLLALDRRIAGNANNDAASGARMSGLAGQLGRAAAQRADYVTVEMGANDLCTNSVTTMTPTANFEAQFRAALAAFVDQRPSARILVASIPDLYWLWQQFHTNAAAQFVWSAFGICQSMLSVFNTETQRQQVVAQELAYNDVLARVCAEFSRCRSDGGAVYDTKFAASDVSTVDYFHPSIEGQHDLAAITWTVGYWSTT